MSQFLALLLVLSVVPQDTAKKVPAPAKLSVNAIVQGVQDRYKKVTDFKASFRQVVKRKHLPRPRKNSGKVFFKAPDMMRWDYTSPEKVYYISDGVVLWSYQPAEKIAYKMRVKDSELYAALKFLFGKGDLRKEFKVKLGKSKKGLIKLLLTPKIPQTNYKRLALSVDARTFEIKRTALTDPLGNVSTVTFSNIQTKPLNAKAFKFKPPAGVKVEDLAGSKRSPKAKKPTAPLAKPKTAK
jgi:outer membrane lipoprotein carrier protein